MNFSFRIRRKGLIGAAVLGMALGGFAAVAPAHADTSAGARPDVVGSAVIADYLQAGGVTASDAILTCTTSKITHIAIGGTEAVAVPVGCLTEYVGEWVGVTWSGTGVSTRLTLQPDGNFVLYAGNGKVWGSETRGVDISTGPGCLAGFQSDANLVVSNCNGTAIWNSGTHTYPDAVLAFQADGNLVIYDSVSTAKVLWSTKTS